MSDIKTPKDFLIEEAKRAGGSFLPHQIEWIVTAMKQYAVYSAGIMVAVPCEHCYLGKNEIPSSVSGQEPTLIDCKKCDGSGLIKKPYVPNPYLP